MPQACLERILFVDDEPHVLDGISRHWRRQYNLATAVGGAAGMAELSRNGPFAVVVSDMRMPNMNGAEFLKQVLRSWPNTVRILLTGHSEIDLAIQAVNEGNIFRFLTKPCPPETLQAALNAALDQHRLITAEQVLLEQTLHGSIKALTELLAISNPAAFGRATRIRNLTSDIAKRLKIDHYWQLEVAAMVSQIGCITLPQQTAERLALGLPLAADEEIMISRLPQMAEKVLASIPRLESVREILAKQEHRFDAQDASLSLPIGSRILKVVMDFDFYESRDHNSAHAISTLESCVGRYDPAVIEALRALTQAPQLNHVVEIKTVDDIRCGMVLAEDVLTKNGMLLVSRGQEVSENLLERLRNFAAAPGIKDSLKVFAASASRGAV